MKKIFEDLADGVSDVVEGIGDALKDVAEARRRRYQQAAAEVGLQADKRGRFHGEIGGVPVRRWSEDRGGKDSTVWYTVTEFTLPQPVPGHLNVRPKGFFDGLGEAFGARDVQTGLPYDRKLWVTVSSRQEDAARALLTAPEVDDRIRALLGVKMSWKLQGRTLKTSFRGKHTRVGPRGLRLGVEVVQALAKQLRPPWEALARDLDLPAPKLGTLPALQGHLRGVPVHVEVKMQKTRITTWVLAWFAPHLPAGTEVVHRDRNPKGDPLGDPMLDRMLRAESSHLDPVRHRLGTDAARGPLLEVVHGFPGSAVRDDRVVLRLPGHAGPLLRRRVDLVVELASALSTG